MRFNFSKLKNKEFVKEFLVQKASKLMQTWFPLRGKI